MDTLNKKNRTREPIHFDGTTRRLEEWEVTGHGGRGDSVLLESGRLVDLEIYGSLFPFKWEQDGMRGIRLTLREPWRGYMLIPVMGMPE